MTGTLQTPGGLPVANGTLGFSLKQAGLAIGTGGIVPETVDCYTSADGSVVGLPNPLASVVSSVSYGSGTLPAGTYYVTLTFYATSPSAQETLASPEARIQLTGSGTLTIQPPVSWPANAAGMKVYLGAASGGEQYQGQTTGKTAYSQSVPLISGAASPSSNNSICSLAFNDTIIPYTGYDVSLTSSSGNAYPGWPQAWQLNGGLNGTVNVSQGAPLWNGVTIYPQPILAQPLNHGPQSISGLLNLTGYNLVNVGAVGVGTSTPSWPVDVENGAINASGGYLYDGAAPLNHVLLGDGAAYVDSPTIPASIISGLNLHYQTVKANGSSQPQEPALDFSSSFTLTDHAGVDSGIDLADTAVTPGSYTNAGITVNSKGQVTAASNGAAIPIIQTARDTSVCTTGSNSYDTCDNALTWPVAFSDVNYYVTCSAIGPNDGRAAINGLRLKTVSGITVRIVTEGSNPITYSEIDCIGVHP